MSLFSVIRYLWQVWENGKVKSLVSGLDKKTLVRGLQTKEAMKSGDLNTKVKELVHYWRDTRGSHNTWACMQ